MYNKVPMYNCIDLYHRVLARNGIDIKLSLQGVGEGFQDQPLWVFIYQASTNITGHIPFSVFATAQDIFGDDTNYIAASTRGNLSLWSRMLSQRLNGDLSPNILEKRLKIHHDMIFNKKASMVELAFFAFSDLIGITFALNLPFSWGSVHLDSPGAINNPAIDPNFLSIDFDTQTAIRSGRLARKIWNIKPLRDFAGTFLVPGDAVLPENATDAEWTEFLTGPSM